MGFQLKNGNSKSNNKSKETTLEDITRNTIYKKRGIEKAFEEMTQGLDSVIAEMASVGLWSANTTDGLRKGGLEKNNIILQIFILFRHGLPFLDQSDEEAFDSAMHIYGHLQESLDYVIQTKEINSAEKRVEITCQIISETLSHVGVAVSE